MKNNFNPIEIACSNIGSQSNLAKFLSVSPSVVHHWVRGLRPVPAIYCSAIEQKTGVLRKDLRPKDWKKIWPELQ